MTTYSIPPTVLYIKQHSITGLKYFGKTARDPLKYNGSGIRWKRHIKKHGREHVTTLWVSEPYIDSDTIMKFALKFSMENNIVESSAWANLIIENGLGGGGPHSTETKQKMSDAKKGKPTGRKGIPSGKTHSDESKQKMSDVKKGKPSPIKGKHRGKQQNPAPKVKCPHCGKNGSSITMHRYHFDRCKDLCPN